MKITLTVKAHITVASDKDARSLVTSMEAYRLGCNLTSQYVFAHDFELRRNKLQKALYNDLRAQFALKSQMAISVIRTTVARYQALGAQIKKRPFRYYTGKKDPVTGKNILNSIPRDLTWLWSPISFKRPQLDLVRGRDYSFKKNGAVVSLNTLDGRIECGISMPGFEKFLDGSWKFGTAKVLKSSNHWFLYISMTKEILNYDFSQIKHVVGIDRGLRQIVTCYNECGKSLFHRGKEVANKRQHYKELRRHLKIKNTRNSRRRLRKFGNREHRWMSDYNHCLSKTLVEHYGSNTLFVLEDLSNVICNTVYNRKKEDRYEHHSWSFYDLEQKLTYKAHLAGSEVVEVDAHYTSQRCPKCGRINRNNRKHDLHLYICDRCGYRSNDDRIGAMNIQNLGALYVGGLLNPSYRNECKTKKTN
ncbi:RNA-guided endonuclease InsQ/TnpB family protein [Lactobacillus sp.]|uniref:RNA-guided endonuclease InsQ/TnpB family protein n=1 Tax=Lactobacillus sp. TaxID=1591 RepID=UPI003EF585AE